jgi:hypothetical protein
MSLKRRELVTGDGSSGGLGGVWMRWSITRQGREKVGEILARDNYRGPAPVPVEQYLVQLQQQRLTRYRVSPRRVERAFSKLPSGQKMKLPFDCLVVFSTNLDPRSLADDAFLRRIRYKIRVGPPSAAMYREIFRRQCEAWASRTMAAPWTTCCVCTISRRAAPCGPASLGTCCSRCGTSTAIPAACRCLRPWPSTAWRRSTSVSWSPRPIP